MRLIVWCLKGKKDGILYLNVNFSKQEKILQQIFQLAGLHCVDQLSKITMKTVIITGGAQGIGRITAEVLATAAWQIAVLDYDAEALAEISASWDDKIFTLLCDVANEIEVKRAVQAVIQRFGRLNGLVNNAATSANQPVEQLDTTKWNHVLAVNLTGPMLMVKHCAKHLRRQNGSVINIGSTRAHMSEPNTEAYSASKGGLLALTHALAISLGPEIRVNSISPGWIDVSNYKKASLRQPEKLSEADHSQHPVGRVGTPYDIAEMVLFLLSDNAGFITGQDFIVDGGMTKKMIYL